VDNVVAVVTPVGPVLPDERGLRPCVCVGGRRDDETTVRPRRARQSKDVNHVSRQPLGIGEVSYVGLDPAKSGKVDVRHVKDSHVSLP